MGRDENSHGKGFVKGAVFGTLIGGLAALLLAPKAGKETQEELKERAKKVVRNADVRISEVEAELEGHIDSLKAAAQDLRGEAYDQSQILIKRAELLKVDLQASANRLAKNGRGAKQDATSDAKRLVNEGQSILSELERMTKKIIKSAGTKAANHQDDDGKQPKK